MFAVAVNCIDGRTQEPLINYLKQKYQVDYVDLVTEAGAVKFLCERRTPERDAILKRIRISLDAHKPEILVIAAHHDCAGNPVSDETQKTQLKQAKEYLLGRFPYLKIVTLWLDGSFKVEEIQKRA